MKLTHHISSAYVAAANALKPQKSRRKVIAYVESYDDVFFWRTVLRRLETAERYFEIMLPTRRGEERTLMGRGKKSAIFNILENTGRDMIACVDADYDYLMQRATPNSRQLLDTPYIFHTVAYAIENLQCYAAGLHDVCVMVTLNDHRIFDFETFLTDYSKTVWPLFCWSVAVHRENRFSILSITEMDKIITPGKISMENAGEIIARIGVKVRNKVNSLQKLYPDTARSMPMLEKSLYDLGVTRETTYLFIHGHYLFERLVTPLMKSVCRKLIDERETEIHHLAIHNTQMRNELSCYANSLEDITSMLKKSTAYTDSEVFSRIIRQFAETSIKNNSEIAETGEQQPPSFGVTAKEH